MISKVKGTSLQGLNYCTKLYRLRLYSQEQRRERYQIILAWKISQGLVSGYKLEFTSCSNRTGRKAIPAPVQLNARAAVRNARAATFGVKGAKLFNLMPINLLDQ